MHSEEESGGVLISMDHIPVEVIGHILSLIGAAHHVVIASFTCRKWRQAFCNYLHTLTFDDDKEHTVYARFSTTEIQTLITNTIFQTTGLQCLSITMDGVSSFSTAFVIDCLIYTGKTLRKLHYNLRTTPNFNILDKFDASELEVLDLAGNTLAITSGYKIFLCLRCLSLSRVVVSPLDLSLLLSACPNIEVFELDSLKFVMPDEQTTMELTTSTLKEACLQFICFDNLILKLKADNLVKLQVKNCRFKAFELVGKGTLRFVEIENVTVSRIDIGDNFQNLEVVIVIDFQITWEKFHSLIERSAGLRRLELWFPGYGKIVNMESIAVCFPLLSHLALHYELSDGSYDDWNGSHYNLGGSYHFDNVVVLELECLFIDSWFPLWLDGLLDRCPKLKNLVICGLEFFEVYIKCSSSVIEKCGILKAQQLDFGMSSISKLMTKYEHVTVQFRYI